MFTSQKKAKNEPGRNNFNNGWTLGGMVCYTELMHIVRRSRTLYNESFNHCMKIFATSMNNKLNIAERARPQNSHHHKSLENDLKEFDAQSILNDSANSEALAMNKRLMEEEIDLNELKFASI